jgi:6-phosphogluconolactonase (cycloisomerase 2 family)
MNIIINQGAVNILLFNMLLPISSLQSSTNNRLRLVSALLGASLLGLAACKKDSDNSSSPGIGTVLYVENNLASGNGILAYHQEADGSLKELTGSPFATGGAGFANPNQTLGPDDTDEPLALSADKKRLYAVNQGSHTISVFDINTDGTLKPVAGSPFPSGGLNPVSIGVVGSRLYVINKSDDADPATTDPAPTYAVFDVAASGALTAVPGAAITTTSGASPAHALVAPGQRLLFVDDFLAFQGATPRGTLRAFAIGSDGKLTAAPGTPLAIPLVAPATTAGGALGLWAHPTQNVLYVGFPVQNKLGVYTYDPVTGTPTFVRALDSGMPGVPSSATCWLRVNKAGTRLYALNSGQNSVSVFDLTNAQNPVQSQVLALKNAGPLFGTTPANQHATSQAFHLTFSPDEQALFVISDHASTDYTTSYNYVHSLRVAADGSLSESTTPAQPAVPATARPQGAVSLTL